MKYIIEIEDGQNGATFKGNPVGNNESPDKVTEAGALFEFLLHAADVFIATKNMDLAQSLTFIESIRQSKTIN